MTTSPAKGQPKNREREPRAPQISHWLDFIRPHLDPYRRLPRGEQKKYLEKLSEGTKTKVKTLRGFLAAAEYLESNGITAFPDKAKRMPVASIEAIMRIAKVDRAHANRLLAGVSKGLWSVQSLREELETANKQDWPLQSRAAKVNERQLLAALHDQMRFRWHDLFDIRIIDFERSGLTRTLFHTLAYPRAVAYLPRHVRVGIFDESSLAWGVSPNRAKLEFLRNVVVALAILDYVLVCCTTLGSDVEQLRSQLRKPDQGRIAIIEGILDLKPDDTLSVLAG